MMIVLIVLALSIVALILSVNAFVAGNEMVATYLLVIGFIAMGLSVYVLFQSRKRVASMKIEAPKVMTTVECKKCGFKSVRKKRKPTASKLTLHNHLLLSTTYAQPE
jgi:DNA-directed RNA polymerase subunit RPC12/RpoP